MQIEKTVSEDKIITLKITIPWKEVEETRNKVIEKLVKNVTIPGFRRGMAPRNVAEPHLKKEVIQEEVLKETLGNSYNKAIKQESISPIINPSVHVDTFEDGTDLTFTAEVCEAPEVILGDYKSEIAKITAKTKIIVPGEKTQKPNINDILNAVVLTSKVVIPKVLYQQEANRLLAQTLDELKKLGLTLESYLSSRGKSADDLRAESEDKAKKDLALEFILRKIADVEKITVEKEDINAVLNDIKDEGQKKQLMANPYFVISLIRQQKTLDFLSNI